MMGKDKIVLSYANMWQPAFCLALRTFIRRRVVFPHGLLAYPAREQRVLQPRAAQVSSGPREQDLTASETQDVVVFCRK